MIPYEQQEIIWTLYFINKKPNYDYGLEPPKIKKFWNDFDLNNEDIYI